MTVLIVLESPGQGRRISSILRKREPLVSFEFMFCDSLLFDFGSTGLGFDPKDFEPKWKVASPKLIAQLKRLLPKVSECWVATSRSYYGDLLAQQLASFCADHGEGVPCVRRDPYSLDQIPIQQEDSEYVRSGIRDRILREVISDTLSGILGAKVELGFLSSLLLSELARVERSVRKFIPSQGTQSRILFDDGAVILLDGELDPSLDLSKLHCTYSETRQVLPPPAAFDLFSLLEFLGTRYGMRFFACLEFVSKLFDQALISDPAGCSSFDASYLESIHSYIRRSYAGIEVKPAPLPPHAIVPADINIVPSTLYLPKELKTAYSAIWFRSLASQGNSAMIVRQENAYYSGGDLIFRSEGSQIKSEGWTQLGGRLFDPPASFIEPEARVLEATLVPFKSQAPPQHTLSTLISWLRSKIDFSPEYLRQVLELLFAESYVEELIGGRLRLLPKGELVVTAVKRLFPDLLDIDFLINAGVPQLYSWAIQAAKNNSCSEMRSSILSPSGEKTKVLLHPRTHVPYVESYSGDWRSDVVFDAKGKICLASL